MGASQSLVTGNNETRSSVKLGETRPTISDQSKGIVSLAEYLKRMIDLAAISLPCDLYDGRLFGGSETFPEGPYEVNVTSASCSDIMYTTMAPFLFNPACI